MNSYIVDCLEPQPGSFTSTLRADARPHEHASSGWGGAPLFIPETINCDRGRVYLSETFLRACASLGISVQPARPYTGSDKTMVERTFESINTLFCQHVAGYAGRDTTRRGPDVDAEAVWKSPSSRSSSTSG